MKTHEKTGLAVSLCGRVKTTETNSSKIGPDVTCRMCIKRRADRDRNEKCAQKAHEIWMRERAQ